jgi:hypothetical protein
MIEMNLAQRLAANGLKLSDEDIVRLAEAAGDIDKASARLRAIPRSYLEEPAVVFRAKPR